MAKSALVIVACGYVPEGDSDYGSANKDDVAEMSSETDQNSEVKEVSANDARGEDMGFSSELFLHYRDDYIDEEPFDIYSGEYDVEIIYDTVALEEDRFVKLQASSIDEDIVTKVEWLQEVGDLLFFFDEMSTAIESK